jgi:hypothetical protein
MIRTFSWYSYTAFFCCYPVPFRGSTLFPSFLLKAQPTPPPSTIYLFLTVVNLLEQGPPTEVQKRDLVDVNFSSERTLLE